MTEPMALADRWLAALRSRNRPVLLQRTGYPFEWLDSHGQTCAAKQPAKSGEEFAPVLDCLLADSALLRVLEQHDQAGLQELTSSHLQSWARPWQSHAPPDAKLVNAFIKRGGAQADIDVWLLGGAVRGLWIHIEDGADAVTFAEQWLDALKRQDMQTLTQKTSFPFEIRDTGQGAKCGRTAARTPKHFKEAVGCLLNNQELQTGLSAKKPTIDTASEDDPVPSWAERWWTTADHSGLNQTFTTVASPDGISFDLILVTASNGVRAVWMLGSREARD
jgi:hypothetical protein